MKEEQIEKAADRYSFQRLCDDRIQDLELESVIGGSFMAGAEWRINSVWHDVSKEPKEHKLVLIEDDFCGKPDYGVWQAPFPNWKDSIVHFSSKRWAYLDDLLPKRKEKSEKTL